MPKITGSGAARRAGVPPHRQLGRLLLLPALAALLGPAAGRTALAGEEQKPDPAVVGDITADAQRRFVTVRIKLKKDEGDYPDGVNIDEYLVRGRKPRWLPGVAWGPRTVIVADPCVPGRFVESVAVVAGGEEVAAKFSGVMRRARCAILRTEGPVPGRTPVSFSPAPEDPFAPLWAASLEWSRPGWRLAVDSIPGGRGRLSGLPVPEIIFRKAPAPALVYDGKARPVGYVASPRLVVKGSVEPWKGTDLRGEKLVSVADLDAAIKKIERRLAGTALEVRLRFRHEEKGRGGYRGYSRSFYHRRSVRDAGSNEWHGTGFLLAGNRVLVAADLPRDPIVRIEKIEISVGGSWREASFVGTMRHLGAIVLELGGDRLGGALDLSRAGELRNDGLFLSAIVDHATGKRRVRVSHDRLSGWGEGYRGRLHARAYRDAKEGLLAFTLEGELLGLAFSERLEPGEEHRPEFKGPYLFPTGRIAKLLAADDAFDPVLKPLPKKEEKRIVWLGVECQRLTPHLARAHKAEVQTHAGRLGLLVTHVYSGSPAERLGIARWDILLRLEAEGRPPVDLEGSRMRMDYGGFYGFMANMPEEFRARAMLNMPPPWPSRGSQLTTLLTRLGEGTRVNLTYLRAGKTSKVERELERAPADFKSAEKFKSEKLGLTVKELTYEVRHYYRLRADDGPLVIAGIEPGGKAALGKIYPYLLVRLVNGKPVRSVAEFKALAEKPVPEGEKRVLEVTVERFGKTRLVKIQL